MNERKQVGKDTKNPSQDQKAFRLGALGFAIAGGSTIPAWIHSATGLESSGWLILALVIFIIGFITLLLGAAMAITIELEKRD